MANTSTRAEIQTALNDANYDGVSLEGGTYTIDAHLVVPDGKILQGAHWGADLDNANMALLDLNADIQIQLGASFMHHIKIEQDVASTVSATTTTGNAVAEWVRIETSGGAWQDEWAFDTGYRSITHCSVRGLNGINANSLDADLQGGVFTYAFNVIDCNYSAAANAATGIYLNIESVYCHDNYILRGGRGIWVTNNVESSHIHDCYMETCTAEAFWKNGASITSYIHHIVAFNCCNNTALSTWAIRLETTQNESYGDFYTISSNKGGIYVAGSWISVGNLYDTGSTGTQAGISIAIGNSLIGGAYSDSSSGTWAVQCASACDITSIGVIACRTYATGGLNTASGSNYLTIGTIMTYGGSSTAEGLRLQGAHWTIGTIYAENSDDEGVWINSADWWTIGSIFCRSCGDAASDSSVKIDNSGPGHIGQIYIEDGGGNGLEFGSGIAEDVVIDSVVVRNCDDDGITEVAAGDTDRCVINAAYCYNNGGYGINLKTTSATGRNWIRNIICEGNTTAAQVSIASGWVSGSPYAEYYFSSPGGTNITVGGTFQKASGTTTWENSEDFSDDTGTNNRAKYDSGAYTNRTRKYLVRFIGDIESDVAELAQIAFYNNTPVQVVSSVVGVDIQHANERIPISCQGILNMNHDDHVELWVTSATLGTNVTLRGNVTVVALEAVQ
jgi:hypothetical protein